MAEKRRNPSGESEADSPPIPPDGGYGWVIVFASFVCNIIVDGVCFSFGIFYLEFLQHYGESKSKTSIVGSVLNGMYLSMGPIVSALANKFGCRAVTIAGSIMACLSFVLSSFSPNIDVLIVTYGALGGMGFGLMYLPAIVMVGFYFEKRRALATGIAVCGSGIGAFIFAPLCNSLLYHYNWKGATWIIAGITLNGVVMGALFRPLEAPRRVKTPEEIEKEEEEKEIIKVKQIARRKSDASKPLANEADVTNPKMLLLQRFHNSVANGNLQSPTSPTKKNPDTLMSLQDLTAVSTPLKCEKNLCQSMDDLIYSQRRDSKTPAKEVERPLYRKDIFYSGSVTHLAEYKNADSMQNYIRSVTSIPGECKEENGAKGCLRMCKSASDTFGEMMDFSLLKNPVFAVYGLSCFLCMFGFYIPFIYLPDCAILKGHPRDQAAFLLSIIGIANTVGRVLCGWVSDQPWADSLLINNLALIMAGVATIASPFCVSYGLLGAYSCVFGLGIAVFVSLRSILMVELIGLHKLTNAFGLVTMCQGFSAFIGAPIAGALYDITQSYNSSFYVAGISLTMAGVICLPLRRIARWQSKREQQQSRLADIDNFNQEVSA